MSRQRILPLLRAVLIAVLLVLSVPVHGQESEIRKTERSIKNVRGKLQASRAELSQANQKEAELARQLARTQRELEDVQETLRQVKLRLARAETRLDLLKQSIRVAEAKLLEAQRVLERRLRDIHMEGEVSYLAVLLQSSNFTDFINQTEYLQRILDTDRQLIEEVRRRKAELERQKEAAHRTVLEIQAQRKVFEQKVADLNDLRATQADLVAQVQAHRRKLSAYVTELEHISADMEARLQRLIRDSQDLPGSVPPSAGRYIYPVQGPITSVFGYRIHPITGTTRFHSGLDFGVGYGTPIRAADHGVVIFAGWYGGYGNAVIVNHGGGYSTLYAHASQLYVT
ncbi:MAG: peptidoglycan DD-metalloendopeptidase family protein, partial [Armatimonadetes bacterium]|nr:peptidoglycan DD-metalloendopeptidase family protein [Armatimonadota bacterium]